MITNKERIGKGLELLSQGLYPYFEKHMQSEYDKKWDTQAKQHLVEHKKKKKCDVKNTLREDTGALLTVISKEWDKVFKNNENLDNSEKGFVEELIQVRHNWAHKNNYDFLTKDTERSLDSMVRLIKAVKAEDEIIQQVEKHQQAVFRLLVQEQNRQENRQVSAGEGRIREKLTALLDKLQFQDASLLQDALTHRSYLYENPREVSEDNELLEFLGDAVLNFLSGEYLYRKHKAGKNEGDLTRLRSALVEDKQLAKFAEQLEIGNWIRLGKGAIADAGSHNFSLLSNTFEAIIGAYFLDSGIDTVRDFVTPLFESAIADIISLPSTTDASQIDAPQIAIDPKNLLQQWVHKNIGPITPEYKTIKEEGPPHDKKFTVQVKINGQVYSQGTGSSKKAATKKAAENALKNKINIL